MVESMAIPEGELAVRSVLEREKNEVGTVRSEMLELQKCGERQIFLGWAEWERMLFAEAYGIYVDDGQGLEGN